jgi:hypothetical protein
VWFVKTHYPLGRDIFFTANKAICCVRNPLDIVKSMFNFWTTQTQNKSVTDDEYHLTFADDWKKLVQNEITCWRDFHKLWIDLSV